jgi:hypothetical protein
MFFHQVFFDKIVNEIDVEHPGLLWLYFSSVIMKTCTHRKVLRTSYRPYHLEDFLLGYRIFSIRMSQKLNPRSQYVYGNQIPYNLDQFIVNSSGAFLFSQFDEIFSH